jgi:hypothetical protein
MQCLAVTPGTRPASPGSARTRRSSNLVRITVPAASRPETWSNKGSPRCGMAGDCSMTKYKIVCLFAAIAAGISLAPAQNSKAHSPSAKPSPAPVNSATKPLTPKSAMPPAHKPSSALPRASTSGRNANAELTRLERQNINAAGSKKPAKGAPVPKSADTPNRNGSGINSSNQKPTKTN